MKMIKTGLQALSAGLLLSAATLAHAGPVKV
jgi:hypothetical protein